MNSEHQAGPAQQAAPDRRIEFEKFLADLSARFVAPPPDRVDHEIQKALKAVLEFFQLDRCNLIRVVPGEGEFRVTHNADVNGISPYTVDTPRPISLGPWVHLKIGGRREVASFASLDELPAEAAADKQHFQQVGVGSGARAPSR